MGIFKKIGDFFAKYSIEAGFEEEDLFDGEDIAKIETPDRNEIDISNPMMRERYVRNCCDQMLESTREIDEATREYRLVTDYLNDMETIDKLPPERYGPLKHAAEEVMRLETKSRLHSEKIGRISNDRYEDMEAIASDMPGALEEMKKNEDYKFLVRGDLQKLEGEKGAYAFQKKEMSVKQVSCRNFVMITICSLSFIILMLLVLKYMYQMDVILGCVIASFAAAVAMTLIFVEYIGAGSEMRKASNFLNQVIAKQNTVKIRYVNVENLLQYQYRKYHVNSSDELEYFWDMYLEEKNERQLLDEAGGDLKHAMDTFMSLLKSIRLKYPTIWSRQAYAVVDRREMVELRHDLVERRQSLRKRIEYNNENRNMAKDEVNELVKKYPNYASQIIAIVSAYEKDEK
ncbi:MAG: hypothetical protein K6F86_11905 [Lachnospiraceae bacterium]|nr:hypothetical protein [Lachnospiraceae bacterium]